MPFGRRYNGDMDEPETPPAEQPHLHQSVVRVWRYSQLSEVGRLWFAHAWAASHLAASELPVPEALIAEFHALDARWDRSQEEPVERAPQEYAPPEQLVTELSPSEVQLMEAGDWYRANDTDSRRLLLKLACVRYARRHAKTPQQLIDDLRALDT